MTRRRDHGERSPLEALAVGLGAATIAVALPLVAVSPAIPLGAAASLALGWAAGRLPSHRKYLLVPELGAPLALLAVPAFALAELAGAQVEWLSVVAACAFLAALILACHDRDRRADLEADVPTLATRDPVRAGFWLWVTTIVGALAATAALYRPLDQAAWLAVAGAVGFVAARMLGRVRVPAMVGAHALFALSLLLR